MRENGHAVKSYSAVLNSMPEVAGSELVGDAIKEEIELSIGKAFSEILDEINSDIKKVSWGCGIITDGDVTKSSIKKLNWMMIFQIMG